jgi:hypothetical protein
VCPGGEEGGGGGSSCPGDFMIIITVHCVQYCCIHCT